MDEQERNQIIQDKLNEGMSLSEVQEHLRQQYNETITYMELRLIATDLDVDWRQQEPPEGNPTEAQAQDVTAEAEPQDQGAAPGKTQVSMSKVVRPGAAVSGDVTFASGAKAEWYVDHYGRLGINPASDSDQPTEEDLQEFQTELQKQLGGQ